LIHENEHKEEESPVRAVIKEMSGAILFVAAALGIAWLEQLFPGGKAPTLVKAFVVVSDLVLILGATIACTRALRTLFINARDIMPKVTRDSAARTSEAAPELGCWAVTLRGPDGRRYPPRLVQAGNNPDSFRSHLVRIARIEEPGETDAGEQWIGKYELEVRKIGTDESSPSLVTLRWDGSSPMAAPMAAELPSMRALREAAENGSPMVAELPSPSRPAENDNVAKVVELRSSRRMR